MHYMKIAGLPITASMYAYTCTCTYRSGTCTLLYYPLVSIIVSSHSSLILLIPFRARYLEGVITASRQSKWSCVVDDTSHTKWSDNGTRLKQVGMVAHLHSRAEHDQLTTHTVHAQWRINNNYMYHVHCTYRLHVHVYWAIPVFIPPTIMHTHWPLGTTKSHQCTPWTQWYEKGL